MRRPTRTWRRVPPKQSSASRLRTCHTPSTAWRGRDWRPRRSARTSAPRSATWRPTHSLLGALRQQPFRINLGGGLPAGADPADLRLGIDSSRLILEPGRSLVAGAGSLLTRVVRVQARATCTYLVADAGMTELIRPMLYGADHPVSLVEPGARLPTGRPVHLAGPVCEAGDILARDLDRWLTPGELATAGGGALLAIRQAGAYGAAMSSNYNGRLRPAEAVIEGGQLRLSRRRETLEDLVSRDA